MKKSALRLTLAGLGAALLLTACNAAGTATDEMKNFLYEDSGDYNYSASQGTGNFSPGMAAPSATARPTVGSTVSADVGKTAAPAAEERKIVKTLSIRAETKAFDDAAAHIERLCTEAGGYIEESSRSGGSLERTSIVARSASYVLRIPADRLDNFRAGFGDGINVTDERVHVDDITDNYYDVDARLRTLKLQEERLLAMLEQANELEYMIALEQRLSDVRYEIESYTGTIRRYDSRVAYSTVNLSLDEVLAYTPVTTTPQTFGERVAVAFRDSWSSFAENCRTFAIAIVYALPTLLVLATIAGIVLAIVFGSIAHNRKKRRGGQQ